MKYLILPILITFTSISFLNRSYAQSSNQSIIYLIDKTKLVGEVSIDTDSTYKVSTNRNEYMIIDKKGVDSISNFPPLKTVNKSNKRVEAKSNYSPTPASQKSEKSVVRAILSAQFGLGSMQQSNNYNNNTKSIQTGNFGLGILIDRDVALSLLCSFETIDKKYFVIYPDLRFHIGGSKNIVRGLFEINYFNNKFFGIESKGSSLNIIGGLALGTDDFRVILAPSVEYINSYQFTKLNFGISITP